MRPSLSYAVALGALAASVGVADLALGLAGPGATSALGATSTTSTSTINDSRTGTGPEQVSYAGDWRYQANQPTHWGGDQHFSWLAGATATVRFTGTRVVLHGTKAPDHGQSDVSIDGRAPVLVDHYQAGGRQDGVAVYVSPALENTTHTIRVRVRGSKSWASRGSTVNLDRVVVTKVTTTPPSPTPTATPTSSVSPTPRPTPTNSATPTPAPTPSASTSLGRPVTRSGLAWRSGAFFSSQTRANLEGWERWRGRRADVVTGFSGRATWQDVIYPGWLYDVWAGMPDLVKVYSVAMVPEQDGSATMEQCAAGAYDDRWREFGRFIRSKNQDDAIIRLGWEFSGNWYKWSARDPGQWAACWRKIVTAAEQTAPRLRWDWNPNRGPAQTHALEAYPGDAYVDIIGVDTYDHWPPATDEASWNAQATNGGLGLFNYRDFARRHGKRLSVPEWGVSHWSGAGGGDNPFYVRKMAEFFRSNADLLAYETYHESDGAPSTLNHDLSRGDNPRSAAEYVRQYRQ